MFINIYLSSKNLSSLKIFTSFILKLVNNKKLISKSLIKTFQFKTTKKIFTVLKSPHVNKTAQTQLEYRMYKKQVTIFTTVPCKVLFFFKYIQDNLFADVTVKLKLNTNPINSKKFYFYNNKYDTRLYLKYLDACGELKFKNCLDSSAGRAKD